MTKISSIMLLLLAGSLLLVSACIADDQGAVNSSSGFKSECTGPGGACIIADFIASPTTGTAPFKVEFMDTSTGYPTSWHWDFGDGTSANGMAQPSHTYEKPGFYTVTLTTGSLSGGTDTRIRTDYIAVMDKNKLQADFLANPTNGDAPLTVRFTDCSVGIVETWHWDFGDGITADTAAPIHTYAKPGKYTVTLTVSSRTAGTSTKVKENYILVEPTCVIEAHFNADPSSGPAPLTVTFSDCSVGNPTMWSWDFGDGTVTPMAEAESSCTGEGCHGSVVKHTYTTPGTYTVTMTAESKYCAPGTATRTITVTGPSAKIHADFTGVPTSGKAPLTVKFTDCSTGGPTMWHWDFGDESVIPMDTGDSDVSCSGGNCPPSMIANPTHTYTKPGVYTVTLTASNQYGGSDKKVKTGYIRVEKASEPINADFTGVPASGQAPLAVQFTDCSTGGPTMWYWDFGDGTNEIVANPAHTYTQPGTYTVTLTASNQFGATDTEMKNGYITVGEKCQITARFDAVPESGPAPLTVQFTDRSVGNPTMWHWDFGDESVIPMDAGDNEVSCSGGNCPPSMIANPTHTYTKPGTYTVTLTASSQNCAPGTYTKTITVGEKCQITAQFDAVPESGPAPLTVQFTDRSVGNPTMWHWDFGDGVIPMDAGDNEVSCSGGNCPPSMIANPTHTYTKPGTYTVTLTASSQNCAPGTYTKTITVGEKCQITAQFDAVPENGPAPLTVQFTDRSVGNPTMWHWDFGDGVIPMDAGDNEVSCSGGNCPPSMIANPTHTYTKPGTYTVTLTASSQTCAPGTFSKTITVSDKCQITAQFDAVPEKGEAPLTVQFTDRSVGNPTMWYWDFGDGVIPMDAGDNEVSCSGGNCPPSMIANPVHTYTEPGIYSVTLTASSQTCAPGTATKVIEVLGGPVGEGIPFSPGWNFVSVPKKLAPGSDTASIFKKIDAGGHSMFQYDAVKHIWTTMTASSPVRPLEGYWIYSTKADTVPLTYDTNPVQTPPTIDVKKGWNAIGFTGMTPIEAKYTLLSVENKWVNCVGFNAVSQQYEQMIIKGSNDQTLMKPYMGYWLYMSGDGILAANAA